MLHVGPGPASTRFGCPFERIAQKDRLLRPRARPRNAALPDGSQRGRVSLERRHPCRRYPDTQNPDGGPVAEPTTPEGTTSADPVSPVPPAQDATQLERAMFEVKRVIVGQDRMIERMFVALLARGHCLLEGVPGVAKTLAVETLARVVGGTFARVQFTPDLVPADIVGT